MNTSKGWAPEVPLWELLSKNNVTTDLAADTQYREVTVKLWGRGVVERRIALGSEIAAARRSVVRAGQFILSRIDARNGATGIVPDDLDGAVVSNDFPTFDTVPEKLVSDYLGWLSKTRSFIDACKRASEGTTNRVRLKEDVFLRHTIPLPPLAEQRRIVTKIEHLAGRIDGEIKAIVESSSRDLLAFWNSIRKHHFIGSASEELPRGWKNAKLSDITSAITDGTHQTPDYLDVGVPFLSAQNVKPYRFLPEGHKYVSEELYRACIARGKPEVGDVLMTRVGAMIGEAALIDRPLDFAYYVSLCLIKPHRDLIHPEYLVHWLNSPLGAKSATMNTLGRGHSQGNLNLGLIRNFTIPLAPMGVQIAIAKELNAYMEKVDAISTRQKSIELSVNALLPSILDRAFRGEL